MAEKLIMYYKYINDKVGFTGKMKLATLTKVPSTKASLEPDTEENIQKFKEAVEEITGKEAPSF
ncbi:MAG: hypothetical protein ACLFSQ_07485 [Candidatus Zixiibacteriota bacterium]